MTVVSGTYEVAQEDTADRGHVTFCLQPAARDTASAQRTPTPVRAYLDETGTFSIDLVPDSDLVDVDGMAVYEVTEAVGTLVRSWTLYIPDDTPIDLPAMYPGTDSPPGTVIVEGPPGPQGPPGDPGADAVWWGGTQAEYDAIPVKDPSTLYVITG